MPDADSSKCMRWGVAILLVAIAIRAAFILEIFAAPFMAFRIGDADSYHEWARKIAAGHWFGKGTFYQAPLYPYVLAAIYSVFGESRLAVAIWQSLLGASGCVLLFDAGRRLFCNGAGIVAALALACYTPAIFFEALIQKESLALFVTVVAIWLLVRLIRGERAILWPSLGAALGCLILLRENAVVLVPVLMIWIAVHFGGPGWTRTGRLGMFILGLAIVLGPVALRNAAVGGEFFLTTSQAGPNFYIGNNENANGMYAPLRFGRGDARFERYDAAAIAERELGRRLTPAGVSAYWTHRAWSFIRSHPGSWLRLMWRKIALVTNATEIADTEDLYAYSDYSRSLAFLAPAWHFGILAPMAFMGLVARRRERATLWVFPLVAVAYAFSVTLFYILSRYRVPLVPLLCLFAAAGLTAAGQLFRARAWRELGVLAVATFAAAVASNWPLVAPDTMRAMSYFNFGTQFERAGDLPHATNMYQKAVELNPRDAIAHYNLGNCYVRIRQFDTAAAHFEAALSNAPDFTEAALNLGNTWLDRGDARRARHVFYRALALDPRSARARNGLGIAYSRLGDHAQAVLHFEQARQLDPELPGVADSLNEAKRKAGDRPFNR